MSSSIVTLVIGIIAGFLANYLIEQYKDKILKNRIFESFYNDVFHFLNSSYETISVQLAEIKQEELDNELGIRNLKMSFSNNHVYKELFLRILFFNSSEIKKQDYELVDEVKKRVHQIHLILYKIDTSTNYNTLTFNFHLQSYKNVKKLLDEINQLLQKKDHNKRKVLKML